MLKYICISDLHAGAPTSLLTTAADTKDQTPELGRDFAKALGSFLGAAPEAWAPPQLILLGDILDLQFSDRDDAFRSARAFLREVSAMAKLDPCLIATAGNHDHALWSDARLATEANRIGEIFGGANAEGIPDFRKSTPAFSRAGSVRSGLLDALAGASGFTDVDFRYPNIGFARGKRAVVLHHGHFIEDMYRLTSRLKDLMTGKGRNRLTSAEISSENTAWIDFFWSSFGDAGMGGEANELYQNMLTSTGYRRLSAIWADTLGHAMSERLPLSGDISMQAVLRATARVGLDVTVGAFRDTERYAVVDALTRSGREGVAWYLDGPVRSNIDTELRDELPDEVTFVFGHTHKPFADRLVASRFARPLKTYNTGGWTLNGPRLDNAEGASMVLIDDKMNVVSLRIFGTPANGVVPTAYLEVLSEPHGEAAPFVDDIERMLERSRPAWETLAGTAKTAYDNMQRYILEMTEGDMARMVLP